MTIAAVKPEAIIRTGNQNDGDEDWASSFTNGLVENSEVKSFGRSSSSLYGLAPPKLAAPKLALSEAEAEATDNCAVPRVNGGQSQDELLSERASCADRDSMDSKRSSDNHNKKSCFESQVMPSQSKDNHEEEYNNGNDDPGGDATDGSPFRSIPDESAGGIWREIRDDFDPSRGGDRKILRAIGRTATVNAVVAATAALGPIAAVAGYATGGAITAKRLVGDGIARDDPREVAKSLAVFGSATSASLAGQAITGAVAIGVLGASLPLAGALAFGVGCASGITAGALSEWGVDGVMKKHRDGVREKHGKEAGADEDDATRSLMTSSNPSNDDRGGNEPKKTVDKLFPANHRPTVTKTNLIDLCGTWVARQRESNGNRSVLREKARGMEAVTQTMTVEPQKSESPISTLHGQIPTSGSKN